MSEGKSTLDEHQAEIERLRSALEEAEAARRTSNEFLAGMSHALRTPLNAILGFSQILRQESFGRLNQKQIEFLGEIQASGDELLGLITDVLDMARTGLNGDGLRVSPIGLRDFLAHSQAALKDDCAKHGGRLVLETPDTPDDVEFEADPQKIRRVLADLLRDMARQNPRGETISLLVRRDGNRLAFSIGRSGIPAPGASDGPSGGPENKPGEAAPGLRADLALARRIIEMHGATLRAESQGPDGQFRYLFDLAMKASYPRTPGPDDAGRPGTRSGTRALAGIEERIAGNLRRT